MLLRCGGCRELVSEWAASCPACRRDTADAEAIAGHLERTVESAGSALLGLVPRPVSGPEVPPPPGPGPDTGHRPAGVTTEPPPGPVSAAASRHAPRHALRRSRRRSVVVVVAVAVVALAAGAAAAGVGAGGATTHVAVPPGRVLSWTAGGAVVSSTPGGSGVRRLAERVGAGLVAAPDGVVVTASGAVLEGPSLVPAGASIPLDGAPGGWRAVGFSDRDRALVATESGPGSGLRAEVVILDDRHRVDLGGGEAFVGDPVTAGVYAVVADASVGPTIERRDAGQPPEVVASAVGLLVALHVAIVSNAAPALTTAVARSITVSVLPDPTGQMIAVGVTTASGDTGVVVMDRNGGLVATMPVPGGLSGSPVWSPDGTSLLYGTSEEVGPNRTRPAITVWRIGRSATTAPAAAAVRRPLGACLWIGAGAVLCADAPSGGQGSTWVLGRPGGPLVASGGPGVPFSWLRSPAPGAR